MTLAPGPPAGQPASSGALTPSGPESREELDRRMAELIPAGKLFSPKDFQPKPTPFDAVTSSEGEGEGETSRADVLLASLNGCGGFIWLPGVAVGPVDVVCPWGAHHFEGGWFGERQPETVATSCEEKLHIVQPCGDGGCRDVS